MKNKLHEKTEYILLMRKLQGKSKLNQDLTKFLIDEAKFIHEMKVEYIEMGKSGLKMEKSRKNNWMKQRQVEVWVWVQVIGVYG